MPRFNLPARQGAWSAVVALRVATALPRADEDLIMAFAAALRESEGPREREVALADGFVPMYDDYTWAMSQLLRAQEPLPPPIPVITLDQDCDLPFDLLGDKCPGFH